MKTGLFVAALALSGSVLFTACGGSSDSGSGSSGKRTLESVTATLEAAIPEITETVALTEDNDPNDKIGRPNGYTAGVVLYDSRAECDEENFGSTCGAMIEVWPTKADAEARRDYIQGVLKSMPIMGSEYDTIRGGMLLRVDGALTPTAAEAYEKAFTSK